MATPSILISPSQELTSITHLLHLFHHRNKNQHRLSKWWKAFSQLRRQLGKLLVEVEALETCLKFSSAPAPNSASSIKAKKKRKEDEGKGGNGLKAGREGESRFVRAARETVEQRVEFLSRWVVPKCFLAFSNVVADNQYAALGLMLMGTLARVQTILKELGAREIEDDDAGAEGAEQDITTVEKEEDARETDLGEVVSRDAVLGIEDQAQDDDEVQLKKQKKPKRPERVEREDETGSGGGEAISAKRPKKKRKKGGDAFDDLFAGLI